MRPQRGAGAGAADRGSSPGAAWRALAEGNARFVQGRICHPHQDAAHRQTLTAGQRPYAMIFGCADSRVAAEIIFDQGLGDLFVVRTAGHVVDPTVLGSLEFGAVVLGARLIVVLGHDACGAVSAAVGALTAGTMPPGYIRDVVERIIPSVLVAPGGVHASVEVIEEAHVRHTMQVLVERSPVLAARMAEGSMGVVGAHYRLSDGTVNAVESLGLLGDCT